MKVLPGRFAAPDDPIFSGGVEMSAHPASKKSSTTSRPATAGETHRSEPPPQAVTCAVCIIAPPQIDRVPWLRARGRSAKAPPVGSRRGLWEASWS